MWCSVSGCGLHVVCVVFGTCWMNVHNEVGCGLMCVYVCVCMCVCVCVCGEMCTLS